MENKLADFKVTTNKIKNKFGDDIAKLKIEKIAGNQILVNGLIKKTIRPLDTEFLAIIDDKKDYIERDISEVYYYVSFNNNNAVDDFNYIITQLLNKDMTKRKQLKHNEDNKFNDSSADQTVESEKKIDKVVKTIEEKKPEVTIEQLEKEIKAADLPNVAPEASRTIENKVLNDNKKVIEAENKEAAKDVIKEKVQKIESESKAILEIKQNEKKVDKTTVTKP